MFVLRSGPGTENLDSGPLSRILATSVQVYEVVSWVITVIEIEIPKSRNSSTYPAPPPSTKHTTGTGSDWKKFPVEKFSRHCPDRQTPLLL